MPQDSDLLKIALSGAAICEITGFISFIDMLLKPVDALGARLLTIDIVTRPHLR